MGNAGSSRWPQAAQPEHGRSVRGCLFRRGRSSCTLGTAWPRTPTIPIRAPDTRSWRVDSARSRLARWWVRSRSWLRCGPRCSNSAFRTRSCSRAAAASARPPRPASSLVASTARAARRPSPAANVHSASLCSKATTSTSSRSMPLPTTASMTSVSCGNTSALRPCSRATASSFSTRPTCCRRARSTRCSRRSRSRPKASSSCSRPPSSTRCPRRSGHVARC